MKKILTILFLVLSGMANAFPVRSMAGAQSIKFADEEAANPNPYITNGLIAMWDGIENADWGVHDSSANEWTNLITGESTISTVANTFTDDGLDIQSSSKQINLNSSAALDAITSGEFTIEVIGFIEAFTSTRFYWITDGTSAYSAQNISLMTHSSEAVFILQKLGNLRNVVSHDTDTAPCAAYGNIVANLSD